MFQFSQKSWLSHKNLVTKFFGLLQNIRLDYIIVVLVSVYKSVHMYIVLFEKAVEAAFLLL